MKKIKLPILTIVFFLLLIGCTAKEAVEETVTETAPATEEENQSLPQSTDIAKEKIELKVEQKQPEKPTELLQIPQPFKFVDVFGEEYQTEIKADFPKTVYFRDGFQFTDGKTSYEDEWYYTRQGIDVSRYQGHIDWPKVKDAGIEFAIIRIGYRGYGQSGTIKADKEFRRNIENAQAVGIDVGVYFFSQAINEEEALEEAEFVIENLKEYELQLPVVYDPESILDAPARTDDVSGEQFTKNTIAFCERVKEAGYYPMIYSNMLWEAFEFDMEQLKQYPFWYADYEKLPQTPYAYEMWQYSNTGQVDGIQGTVDLNIQFMEKEMNQFSCTYGSVKHDFILDLPDETEGAPLVVMLHGYGNTAESFRSTVHFEEQANSLGYGVVYVTGAANPKDSTSSTGWNSGIEAEGNDDVGFLVSLTEYLQKEYSFDKNRTFVVGYSNGAFMAHRLAMEASDTYRAVVSVAGMMPESIWEKRKESSEVSVFQITGEKDDVIPKNSDGSADYAKAPAIEEVMVYWAEAGGLEVAEKSEIGKNSALSKYTSEGKEHQVWHLCVKDGRHSWPEENVSGIDTNAIILEFLEMHASQ